MEKNVLKLGLYDNHFVYIKDIHKLCNKYRCDKCNQVFTRCDNLITHQKNTCTDLYQDKFPENVKEFTHDKNIMKEILEFSKSKNSFMYPYFAVYDFESIAKNEDKRKGKNTIILNKQIPISFSKVQTFQTIILTTL